MTEESQTRRPSMPRSFRSGATTATASVPMRQVPTGWWSVLAGAAGIVEQFLVGVERRAGQALGAGRRACSAGCRMISRASLQPLERHRRGRAGRPSSSDRSADGRRGRRWPAAPCRASADADRRNSASRRRSSASRRRPRCRSRGRDGTGCRASGASGSAYQKPPVSNRLEATGPCFGTADIAGRPRACGAAWRSCHRCGRRCIRR